MTMRCYQCEDVIEGKNYSIQHHQDRLGLSEIRFCVDCFKSIAGEDYVVVLENQIPEEISHLEIEHLRNGLVIQAIKEHRKRTSKGLKESKDMIDKYRPLYFKEPKAYHGGV